MKLQHLIFNKHIGRNDKSSKTEAVFFTFQKKVQKKKFNNTDRNKNTTNTKANSSNYSHIPLPSNSSKQSHTSLSNIFEIPQISPKNIFREIKTAYRKLARFFHPKKWINDKPSSKIEVEEKSKELSNAYEDMIQFFCFN